MASEDHNSRPLQKLGEWDVNDPASAEGFTVIFSKAWDEKVANIGAAGNGVSVEIMVIINKAIHARNQKRDSFVVFSDIDIIADCTNKQID